MTRFDKLIVLGGLVFLLVVLFMIPAEKAVEQEATAELSLYCEMVEIRLTTGDPYLGWPDYKGIYETECLKPSAKAAAPAYSGVSE